MRTPILILTRDRPRQFQDMINAIETYTNSRYYDLIICDNNSTQPEMVAYLDKLSRHYTVIRNHSNLGFEGFNDGLKMVNTDYFIISDPDIMINRGIPDNWPLLMIDVMREANSPKVGLALNISFNEKNNLTKRIRQCETGWWKKKAAIKCIPDQCYVAAIDTTLCMIRCNTYKFWNDGVMIFDRSHGINQLGHLSQDDYNPEYSGPVIRIAGRFTAEHLGWDVCGKYHDDIAYYKTRCNLNLASTTKWMVENGL